MPYTHFDALKRPCKVGDTVLTKGYGSCNMDQIATIVKMTPKFVFIDISATYYKRIEDSTSRWGYRYERVMGETKRMKRDSSSFLVINEQLAYNHETYPELYL